MLVAHLFLIILVEKLKNNQALTDSNPDTFYTPDASGYTDYA